MIQFILALVIATSFVATAHSDVIDLLRAGLAGRSRDDFNEAIRRDPYIAPFYFNRAVARVEPLSLVATFVSPGWRVAPRASCFVPCDGLNITRCRCARAYSFDVSPAVSCCWRWWHLCSKAR
jgi:hypothetical protein